MKPFLFQISLLTFLSCVLQARAQEVHIPLNEGWRFRQTGKEQWYDAKVPGVVQSDLLRNGLIPDFYKGSNIDRVQWVEREDWIYERTLFVTDTLLRYTHLDLVFKGLDTFAEVYLNDSLIGKADNMFRTWEWAVRDCLRIGSNDLKVIFRSPIKAGAELRSAYGIQLPHDSDPTGVSPYIRKAGYQFGWDFCPRLVTSGIWKGVELRGWSEARLLGVDVRPSEDATMPGGLLLAPRLVVDDGVFPRIVFLLNDSLIQPGQPRSLDHSTDHASTTTSVRLARTEIWHPHGNGPQALHRLRCEVWVAHRLVSVWEDQIGHADVQLLQQPDSTGQSFAFVVNGKPTFMKGANLVPPSMTPTEDGPWVELVGAMDRAGMNMVRLWSGGVYPPEAFYDACDTAGILVWQDIMLASLAPGGQAFAQNVAAEVAELVQRTQRHPCVALYCGNNELDVAWRNWGWQDRYGIHGRDSAAVSVHQNEVFNNLIPAALAAHGGEARAYVHTSPLSNWGNTEGLTKGDLHYWGVWHGDSTFSSFQNNVGRFVSEYGFQSYPDSALLAKYIHPDNLYLGSPAVTRLQRSYKTDKPIWDAIERELGEEPPPTLGGFIEASQRAQAKAYGMAIEAHLAAQPHCMGTLLWQLNDCWPGPSWSIIDHEGNPKPAYEVVKRAYVSEY